MVRFEPGSRLSRIEALAFLDCPSLSSIHIPAEIEQVIYASADAFHGAIPKVLVEPPHGSIDDTDPVCEAPIDE
jgi:hypothetical protein